MDPQIKSYLLKISNTKCECGCVFFEKVYAIKKVPGIMIGSISTQIMNIEIMRCIECKEVMPESEIYLKEPVVD